MANWRIRDAKWRDAVVAAVVVFVVGDDDVELGWSACHTSRHLALLFRLVYDCACAKLSLPPPAVSVWFSAATKPDRSRSICMRLSAVRLLECQLWMLSPVK